MIRRQFLAAALLLAVTAPLSSVSAAEPRAYSAPTLATAQKAVTAPGPRQAPRPRVRRAAAAQVR